MSEQQNVNNLVEVDSKQVASEPPFIHPAMKGLSGMNMIRQIGLMLGLAFSVAIAVAVVLWSQEDSYDLLYNNVSEADSAEILEILQQQNIEYKVDTGSGAIMVPTDDVRKIKLQLAAQGLPRTTSTGYELLDKEQGFGSSKSAERTRYQRALEGEIARTIMAIQNVKTARVLLALPEQSVFLRKRKKPSASVVVNLYPGRILEKGQIESIIHLVSSSVPMMESSQVTVVDQKGRLLNSKEASTELGLSTKQFEYKKNVEEHLTARIENILIPLVGSDGMRAQVSADVDFAVTERTQEMFNPDLPALRSEQVQEDSSNMSSVQGVPGALSNQPPPAGIAPEQVAGGEETGGGTVASPGSASKSATRNYELDKTITHTRLASGVLRRLSVAVVIDNRHIPAEDGTVISQVYAQEDINRFADLVKQAVGFDSTRGDQVTVTNVAFKMPEKMEALPDIPLWEQGWFIDLMKQLAAALVIVFLVFGVLKPTMRGLIGRSEEEEKAQQLLLVQQQAKEIGGVVMFDKNGNPMAVRVDDKGKPVDDKGVPIAVPAGQEGEGKYSAATEDLLLLEAPISYDARLEYVQELIKEDAALVAQVIKQWLNDNG